VPKVVDLSVPVSFDTAVLAIITPLNLEPVILKMI
jgi:hypothetical protein